MKLYVYITLAFILNSGLCFADPPRINDPIRRAVSPLDRMVNWNKKTKITGLSIRPCSEVESCISQPDEWGLWHVIISPELTGNKPTHYRVSESPSFDGAEWKAYTKNNIGFYLSPGIEDKNIYFQVKSKKVRPRTITTREEEEDLRTVENDALITGRRNIDGSRLRDQAINNAPMLSNVYSASYRMRGEITVASIGDSLASGEGAPDVLGPAITDATWDFAQCHRSKKNGRALAVQSLQEQVGSNGINFSFFDRSCSGAAINVGLLGPYSGISHQGVVRDALPSQLDEVERWIKGKNKRLDILIVSIGINDIGFSKILAACVNPLPESLLRHPISTLGCDNQPQLLAEIQKGDINDGTRNIGMELLPAAYSRLASRIEKLNPRYILITKYPNPVKDRNGEYCGCKLESDVGLLHAQVRRVDCMNDGFAVGPENLTEGQPLTSDPITIGPFRLHIGGSISNVSQAETQWVSNTVLQPLNTEVENAAHRHGWIVVEPISDEHGVCESPQQWRWFNRFAESYTGQGDYFGTLHPNWSGHEAIRDVLLDSIHLLFRAFK